MIRFCKNPNPSRHLLFFLTNAFVLILLSSTASARQVTTNETGPAPTTKLKVAPVIENDLKVAPKKLPDARVAELLDFAKQHHPEILPLLDFLQTKRPRKFDKVINELNRDISKLERTKNKHPNAHKEGLTAWITQSRIQLYAAQFKVAADKKTAAKLREKIKTAVAETIDTRIEFFERELKQTQAKEARLKKLIENHKATRETTIRKRVNSVTKHAPDMSAEHGQPKGREKPVKKGTAKPAAPANSEQKPTR